MYHKKCNGKTETAYVEVINSKTQVDIKSTVPCREVGFKDKASNEICKFIIFQTITATSPIANKLKYLQVTISKNRR